MPAPSSRSAALGAMLAVLLLCASVGAFLAWIRSGRDGAVAEPGLVAEPAGAMVSLPTRLVELPIRSHNPARGPLDAPVTVVVVSDYQCGQCARLQHPLAALEARYRDRVRWVFKHFPLDGACNDAVQGRRHPRACRAAAAAQCASRQGAFWEYHALLFRNQQHLDEEDLLAFAERLALEREPFQACLDDPSILAELRQDAQDCAEAGVEGTPRTYVAGREFRGAASEAMLDAGLRLALGEAVTDGEGRVRTRSKLPLGVVLEQGHQPMVALGSGRSAYLIDAVEASLDEQGRALAYAGAQPATLSWYDARAACQAAGKRLCSQAEWLLACQGAIAVDDDQDGQLHDDYGEGRAYPYGSHYQRGICHDKGGRTKGGARPAGSASACRSPEGIYDLSGNLQEWAGQDEDRAVLLGGSWYAGERASCSQGYARFGPGLANSGTGFRCCADAPLREVAGGEPLPQGLSELQEGELLPVFQGRSIAGRQIDSRSLQGKPALVFLWASWCKPCLQQLADMRELHGRFAAQGLEVLALAMDRDLRRAKTIRAHGSLPFSVLLDTQARAMGQLRGETMPIALLADPEGRVLLRMSGWNQERLVELQARLEALFQEQG